MVNKVEGDLYKGVNLDSSYSKKNTPKENVQNIQAEETNIQNDTQAYKVELSTMAQNLKPASKDFEDLKAKIEDIKAKISNGSYEIDANKIVQGLVKYFS